MYRMSTNWTLNYEIESPDNSIDWTSSTTMSAVQGATNWNIAANIGGTPENREEIEIPQKLKDFRRKWEQEIGLDEDTKEKIIDAVNKIQRGVKEESDWSILVEFELSWWEKYQTLDVNLAEHLETEYLVQNNNYNWQTKNEVKYDAIRKWLSKRLEEYFEEKWGMNILDVGDWLYLIDKVWAEAGFHFEDALKSKAMWMYLTWNYGKYYWDIRPADPYVLHTPLVHFGLEFTDTMTSERNYNIYDNAGLCLITHK